MRSRAVALALVIATVGAMAVAAPAGASGSQTPAGFGEPDEALVAELMGQGLGVGEALFLASTKVEARAVGDRRIRITESFPTGGQAVINASFVPASAGAVSGPPKVKSHVSGGDLIFSLRYLVSADAIPADARASIGVAMADRASPSAVVAGYSRASAAAAESSGVQVVVKGVIRKYVTDKVSREATEFAKHIDKTILDKYGPEGKLDGFLKSLKAGLSVWDAQKLNDEISALLRQIDDLEKCAKNPTNPLTKKTHKENPAELERILTKIAETRNEIKYNAAVGFIAMLNKTASGLIKSVPGLGYVVGSGTAWSKDALQQFNQDLINDLKKDIVPCTKDYKIDADALGGWYLTAIKCDGLVGQWDATFTSPGYLPTNGSWTFESEPEEGTAVVVKTEAFRFELSGDTAGGYEQSYFVTLRVGGAGTGPTFSIDPAYPAGGTQIPLQVGDFCKK